MMPRMIRPRPPIHHQAGPGHPGPGHHGPGHHGPGHHGPRGPPRGVPPPHVAPFTPGPPVPPANVGNVTNNPSTAKSRVFVGNLNTIALTKEEVEGIFSRYGHVTGISLHKGYAFVQYANEHDARRACIAEDGMLYAGQTLDINIASEPKNRPSSVISKPTTTQTSGSGATRVTLTQGGPPAKKQRLESQPSIKRTLVNLTSSGSGDIKTAANKSITQLTQAAKDVLICGVCKTTFSSLHSLAQHKKIPCRLKISCQCQSTPPPESPEPTQLLCASCGAEFASAWDLVQHCQQEHNVSIYKTDADGGETTEVIEEEVIVQNDGSGELNGQ